MLSPGGKVAQVLHGPSLMGIFLNVLLYGVMITQTHSYYTNFPKDPIWIKSFVGILLLADTLNSAFNMAWIYNVLINQFGNLAALSRADWLFESEEAMAGIIATMVQMFYARRIFVLTKNRWITALVMLSSAVSGLCAIGTAIGVAMRPDFSGLVILDVVALPWLVSCTVCDITIAITLSVYLSRHKTGFQKTDTVVNKIIRSTVQNGLLTASFTIAHIVCYLSLSSGIHMIFNYGVVKLYTNSIMSSLNARGVWQNTLSKGSSFVSQSRSNFVASTRSVRPQVTINVETHEMVDIGPLSDGKGDADWRDDPDRIASNHEKHGGHVAYAV
ncbi:hypothetical protein PHLGIDRAFT_131227 [Phlebiopsis gigantea 11061_1 CR5-6]|uniref:DUF6534 domain-containing protein n=1 Tax=Phlebiopsis gigantea (strain 11061_1 CR5-6) TaxID=745531 RepID=A0A0C3NAK6_PHLG1|nr:hypothetical protein PHLGIDRAFT_131227 [Phlebiopsis gigantea 11061_1 CR5-6]